MVSVVPHVVMSVVVAPGDGQQRRQNQ